MTVFLSPASLKGTETRRGLVSEKKPNERQRCWFRLSFGRWVCPTILLFPSVGSAALREMVFYQPTERSDRIFRRWTFDTGCSDNPRYPIGFPEPGYPLHDFGDDAVRGCGFQSVYACKFGPIAYGWKSPSRSPAAGFRPSRACPPRHRNRRFPHNPTDGKERQA